jgi:hypothetical protein
MIQYQQPFIEIAQQGVEFLFVNYMFEIHQFKFPHEFMNCQVASPALNGADASPALNVADGAGH